MTRTAPVHEPHVGAPVVALRAFLASIGLTYAAGPVETARRYRAPVEVRRFTAGAVTVELTCDDAIAVARTTGIFAEHVTNRPGPGWQIAILRTPSLSAAPRAFAGSVSIEVNTGITALHAYHANLGDAWWIARHEIVLHNVAPGREVGVRYTDPRAARSWAPTLVGRLLAHGAIGR